MVELNEIPPEVFKAAMTLSQWAKNNNLKDWRILDVGDTPVTRFEHEAVKSRLIQALSMAPPPPVYIDMLQLAQPKDAQDAARYRWLRNEASNMDDAVPWHMPTATFLTGDALDILVDVHLKEQDG